MRRLSWPWVVVGVVAAGASLCLAWWIVVGSPVRFGAVAASESTVVWRLALGYLMTVVGVVMGSGYRNLQARRERGETEIPGLQKFARSVLFSVDFWLGVCGSPLVYALLVRATDGGNMAGLIAIAMENGFFCTVIISGLTPRAAVRDEPAVAPTPSGQKHGETGTS